MYKIKSDFGENYYLCVDNLGKEIIIPKLLFNPIQENNETQKRSITKIENNDIKNNIPEFNILIIGLLLLILVK